MGGHGRTARPTRDSNDLARLSDGELSDLSQTISTTATSARAEIEAAVAQIRDALDGLRAAIADHSDRLIAHAGKLDLLKVATEALAAKASGLAAQTAQHVTAATDLQTLISGAITTLDLFPDHSTPEWVQLAADLAAAHAKVDVVVSAATAIQTEAAQVSAAAQQLRSDIDTLTDSAHELVAAGAGIRDHVTMIIAAAQNELAARLETAGSQVAALGSQADAARSNLAQHDRDGTARADAARQQTTAQLAAKAQATKASLQDALASAQSKVAEASATYVQLLALAQLGLANQLPAGNATGATAQAGSYVFRISGTRRGPARSEDRSRRRVNAREVREPCTPFSLDSVTARTSWSPHDGSRALPADLGGRVTHLLSLHHRRLRVVQLPVEVQDRGDEREVGERLREVADLLSGGVDLFGVEADVVGVGQHLRERQPSLVEPPRAGERIDVEERAQARTCPPNPGGRPVRRWGRSGTRGCRRPASCPSPTSSTATSGRSAR